MWVSTIGAAGIPNLAPYSFFNAVAGFPPTLMFSVVDRRQEPKSKDTLRNVQEVDEFVCYVVDEALATAMAQTGAEYPHEVNEFEMANLKTVPSVDVRPFRIKAASVAMECKVSQIVPVTSTSNVVVLGHVLRFHVREDLYRSELGLVDTVRMQPITRLGGPVEYTTIGDRFEMENPQSLKSPFWVTPRDLVRHQKPMKCCLPGNVTLKVQGEFVASIPQSKTVFQIEPHPKQY